VSLRTALTPALSKIDRIMGPDVLDLRATQIKIIQRTWSEGRRGGGVATDAEPAQLPNWIKVRHVTQREIAGSGGRYEEGDVLVGPIRPSFVDSQGNVGGFDEADLSPPVSKGIENVYVLTQTYPDATGIAGEYGLVEMKRDRTFRFMLVLGRRRSTP
jgi:hypothetical protein